MSTAVTVTGVSSVKDLGRAIREARVAMKLRQAEAALLCGVGVRFLSDLERGKETARLGPTLKVINGLGLTLMLGPKKPFWTRSLSDSGRTNS
jgi:HTH-type transcriptional regulator / antitoxin HipB